MPIDDDFPGQDSTIASPYTRLVAVTPHDTNTLAKRPRAIHCGGSGGKIQVKMKASDAAAIELHILQGDCLPIRPALIMSTGTTATGLVAMY